MERFKHLIEYFARRELTQQADEERMNFTQENGTQLAEELRKLADLAEASPQSFPCVIVMSMSATDEAKAPLAGWNKEASGFNTQISTFGSPYAAMALAMEFQANAVPALSKKLERRVMAEQGDAEENPLQALLKGLGKDLDMGMLKVDVNSPLGEMLTETIAAQRDKPCDCKACTEERVAGQATTH